MLEDAITEFLSAKDKVNPCLVGSWLKSQTPEVNELFGVLYDKENVNLAGLYRALQEAELPFKLTTFKNHMKRECACPQH